MPLKRLHDLDQPFIYDISRPLRKRREEEDSKRSPSSTCRLAFSDTASAKNYTLLSPDIVILCYDVGDRRTLERVRDYVSSFHSWGKKKKGGGEVKIISYFDFSCFDIRYRISSGAILHHSSRTLNDGDIRLMIDFIISRNSGVDKLTSIFSVDMISPSFFSDLSATYATPLL